MVSRMNRRNNARIKQKWSFKEKDNTTKKSMCQKENFTGGIFRREDFS